MFPESYQKTLRGHLNESQYLTLKLLLLLLQVHRQVKLSVLASVFPQPIQYGSRKRNLQRFLNLPQLNVKMNVVSLDQILDKTSTNGTKFKSRATS